MLMFVSSVLDKLILSIVSHATSIAHVRFLICVSAFMVIAISNRCESFWTMLALVRFFTSVNAHMH